MRWDKTIGIYARRWANNHPIAFALVGSSVLPDKNFANSVLHLTHTPFWVYSTCDVRLWVGILFYELSPPHSPDHGEWEQCGGSPFSFFQEGGVVVKKS
jgi:hypothetical protein